MRGVTESTATKAGRIMPSVVRLNKKKDEPVVGFPALLNSHETTNVKIKSSVLRSVKRLLGKRLEDLDPAWIESLDYGVQSQSEERRDLENDLQLLVRTDSKTETVNMTPQEVLAIELKAIREACQTYLDKYRIKKNLKVPGGEENGNAMVNNVVVGVPAHYSQRHIGLMKEACREAGFCGYVGTCSESTAAAIAYGLTLQERNKSNASKKLKNGGPTIMVVDMGGGTTDITIASSRTNLPVPCSDSDNAKDLSSSYKVLVTLGDDHLGGDDIDDAIMEYCLSQNQNGQEMRRTRSESLKLVCRKAKESLCRLEDPSLSEKILIGCLNHDDGDNNYTTETKSQEVVITQEILNTIILDPWLQRARDLIITARNQLRESTTTADLVIDEVILVGGTTRVPAVRRMIQDIFPGLELSSSLNPMSSVAQGLAIQAAILSKKVPMHELKSAMMLDCVPHAIGVELTSIDRTQQNRFVEIIPRNTLLPATGSATFILATKHQAGVTVRAVEKVGPNTYEPINKEDFSFVLRKLPDLQLDKISERAIQVGMKLDTDGRFVVSIFDENDPEHVRKKDRYERAKKGDVVGELDYIKDMILAESTDITKEQVTLTIALISLFVLYIAIKIAFTDPLENNNSILG